VESALAWCALATAFIQGSLFVNSCSGQRTRVHEAPPIGDLVAGDL
jgi:hypothetical protein